MSGLIEVRVDNLIGPALDWAVAHATEAWSWAHEWFPTMTLDPTFRGVSDNAPGGHVRLVPNNPMRQESQPFSPSTDWSQGGPLIEKYRVGLYQGAVWAAPGQPPKALNWRAGVDEHPNYGSTFDRECGGSTTLVAVCRAIVKSHFGDVVSVPADLAQAVQP